MSAVLNLAIDDETLARIDSLAEERAVSRQDIVTFAIREFFDAQSEDCGELLPWQHKKVKEGLAAAERGDFASDEEVERVFAKHRA